MLRQVRRFLELVRAESLLVYSELFRRKSLLIMYLIWPYVSSIFMLTLGHAVGSPRVFAERVGVDPPQFMLVGSYLLFSIMAMMDDIMWRPVYDEHAGTLPYIISSSAGTLAHYLSIPIPRLLYSVILGATAVIPVMVASKGPEGLFVGLLVILLTLISALVFAPMAISLGLALYVAGGESWRALNVLRPLLLVLIGVYYPRWLMQWPLYVITSLIPPAHCVEIIQRIVVGMLESRVLTISLTLASLLGLLYSPSMVRLSVSWELKKLREGVKL